MKYEQTKYEPPKYDTLKPVIPINSTSNSNSSDSTYLGFLWALLGIIALVVVTKMIPVSWKDLLTYIPGGDIGITICFFSAVIGCFQFALPLGIGVLIICGIICLAKKS